MAEDGNVRYLRYILLLGEGTLLVLRGIIRREVARTGRTLEAILTIPNNRSTLENNFSSNAQRLHLYPRGSTVNSDIDTWDISLLTLVLQRLFGNNFSRAERLNIRCLRDNRNEIQGHPPALSMEETDYATRSTDLITVLQDLASDLDQHIRDELTRIVNISSSVDFNYRAAINSLQKLYEFKEEMLQELAIVFETVNRRLDTIQGEINDHKQMTKKFGEEQSHMHENVLELKSTVKEEFDKITEMLNKLMSQGKDHDNSHQDVDINIKTKSDRQENATEAQDIILTTFNYILNEIRPDVTEDSGNAEAVLQKVNELLTSYEGRDYELTKAVIELMKDILCDGNILQARKGSVKLTIRFTSYKECLHLIKYINSKKCQDRLAAVSRAMTNIIGHDISLYADIAEESLNDMHKHLAEECEKLRLTRNVILPVQCKGITNLNNIWNLLQKNGADKHMERLSEILTKMVGGNVTVTTSVNLKQFEEALIKLEKMEKTEREDRELGARTKGKIEISEREDRELGARAKEKMEKAEREDRELGARTKGKIAISEREDRDLGTRAKEKMEITEREDRELGASTKEMMEITKREEKELGVRTKGRIEISEREDRDLGARAKEKKEKTERGDREIGARTKGKIEISEKEDRELGARAKGRIEISEREDRDLGARAKEKKEKTERGDRELGARTKGKIEISEKEDRELGARVKGRIEISEREDRDLGARAKEKKEKTERGDRELGARTKGKIEISEKEDKELGARAKGRIEISEREDRDLGARAKEKKEKTERGDRELGARTKGKIEISEKEDKELGARAKGRIEISEREDRDLGARAKEKKEKTERGDRELGARTKEKRKITEREDRELGASTKEMMEISDREEIYLDRGARTIVGLGLDQSIKYLLDKTGPNKFIPYLGAFENSTSRETVPESRKLFNLTEMYGEKNSVEDKPENGQD